MLQIVITKIIYSVIKIWISNIFRLIKIWKLLFIIYVSFTASQLPPTPPSDDGSIISPVENVSKYYGSPTKIAHHHHHQPYIQPVFVSPVSKFHNWLLFYKKEEK